MISRRLFVRNAVLVSAGTWAAALGARYVTRNVKAWFFPERLPAPVIDWLAASERGAAAAGALDLPRRERGLLLDRTAGLLSRAAGEPDLPLERVLRDRIREDFAADRILDVRGWQLSETEAGVFLLQAEIRRGNYKAS